MKSAVLAIVLMLMVLVGCETTPTNYSLYLNHMPTSILVLPPVNNTAEVKASDAFLSTVSETLAECGYYVFPVAVVDRMMKENGVPTPGDMHAVPPAKLREIFGADAVMYITIRQWTTTYVVLDSTTSVTMHYRLLDLASEKTIWHRQQTINQSSNQGNSGGLIGMAVAAATHAILSAALELERSLAQKANQTAFNVQDHGLLRGPRHPEHEQSKTRARELLAKIKTMQEASRANGSGKTAVP